MSSINNIGSKPLKSKMCLILLFYFFVLSSKAQHLQFNIKSDFIGDNREYFIDNMHDQTIFGNRTEFNTALNFDDNYKLVLGVSALYEYGSEGFDYRQFTSYLEAKQKNVRMFLGMFPRKNLLSYPLALLSDTLNYYRPNMEGLFVELFGQLGKINLWVDWTSRQTENKRETFLAGSSFLVKQKILFARFNALMYHHALPAVQPEKELFIRDNMGCNFDLGLNLSELTKLDSLVLSAGGLFSADRDREIGKWNKGKGLLVNLNARYKKIALKFLYYKGERHSLMWGDRFYTYKKYSRIDLIMNVFNTKFVKGYFELGTHFANNDIDLSQRFNLSLNIGKRFEVKKWDFLL